MLFNHLFASRDDFRDFLRSKKFDVSEVPIIDDYFSFNNQQEVGYIISINGTLNKIIGFIFCAFKKNQSEIISSKIEHIFSIMNNAIPYSNYDNKVTAIFVFKDEKVSVIIKNLLHIIVDSTDIVNMLVSDISFSFKSSIKFNKLSLIFDENTQLHFENFYKIPYTEENLKEIQMLNTVKYNLSAVRYQAALNHNYSQSTIAEYMSNNYVGVMLSSVVNRTQPLRLLVNQPTVDMSRKVNNDGKFFGQERITYPVKDNSKAEKLLDHILINEWSKNIIQLINILILYQSTINNLKIEHFSINLPILNDRKKDLDNFELFNIVSAGVTNFASHENFKITFGRLVQLQVKDGNTVLYNYDQKFNNINEAYLHFLEYFKSRIVQKIPEQEINDNTFKLLAMLNI